MRVRISYGIEVEDIPEKVADLGNNTLGILRATVQQLDKALSTIEESDQDYSMVLSMLEKVRLKLTKADHTITDLQAILEGLNNYHNGEQDVSERRPTVDPRGNTTTQTEDPRKG